MSTDIQDKSTEEIGKVVLDYSKYSGVDLYCDGDVEDELLKIARERSAAEYAGVIEKRRSWPILYHLSPLRENIVEWVPMDKSHRVLEVGSGCGAITGALARKAGSVTCVDLSQKRSRINAYRHRECDNVTIHVGNFKDIEPDLPRDYDYICLIGVFEYGQSYIGGETPFEDFLKILMPHLAKGGRILIAIENKYGLKYFAGCREDHLGTCFSGIENYADGGGARTFSRKGLEKIFAACGVKESHFYYPYPDYKFMTTLYSDGRQPGKGELSNNLRNFDRDRLLLFDERNAFDGIAEDGLFPVFSNSFLAVVGEGFEAEYVKYSNERAPEYAIRTEISRRLEAGIRTGRTPEAGNGKNWDMGSCVRKYPVGRDAADHIREMETAYRSLTERYHGGKLEINCCRLKEEGEQVYIEFEFVQGTPLSVLLDKCLERDDQEGFLRLFEEYLERIGYNSEYPAADYDLTFSNILVDGERWTLIDYEWTFGKQVETRELAFRAIHCYLLEDKKRNKLNLDMILKTLKITEEEAEEFREQERGFQAFVSGKRMVMGQMWELIGNKALSLRDFLEKYWEAERLKRIQIYEDRGNGYHEEESYLVSGAYVDEKTVELELKVDREVRMLRIDPAFYSCAVKIRELTFNDVPVPLHRKHMFLNGRVAKPSTFIFPTEDPGINILLEKLPREEENTLFVRMEVALVPLSIAEEAAHAARRLL